MAVGYLFSFLFMLFFCNIANIAQRTFEIVQKWRSHKHGDIINYINKGELINYINKNIEHTSTVCARKSQDFHV